MTAGTEAGVIDASVAVKWYLNDEEHEAQAKQLLTRLSSGQAVLAAPAQIHYEVPSALLAANRRREPRLSKEEAEHALVEFLATEITLYHTADLIIAALPLVYQHDIALYDAVYLALAQQLDVPLITADRRLHQRIRNLPAVVWLGDYAPPSGGEPTP
jgi:predicted nucleic acid-binding protein